MDKLKHPATYTESFIPIFAEILSGCGNILDPFAGVGKIAKIKDYGFAGKVVCNELEPEWTSADKYNVDEWHIGDAANMGWAKDKSFDAICTSPTYGNRMADHHDAKDGSKRITYTHRLGRKLNAENTGQMQWGGVYRDKHVAVYKECRRVLKPDGIFVLNVSNHIRKGVEVDVTQWHIDTLLGFGFVLKEKRRIETPRMKFGANADKRTNAEFILIFETNNISNHRQVSQPNS